MYCMAQSLANATVAAAAAAATADLKQRERGAWIGLPHGVEGGVVLYKYIRTPTMSRYLKQVHCCCLGVPELLR